MCQPLVGQDLALVQEFKRGDRVLPAKSPIYRQGEICTELYNLLDGWAVLYRVLESGDYQILDFALPGSFLGYQPNLEQPMLHNADCLTDVALCIFPRLGFHQLLERNPRLAIRFVSMNARDTVIAHQHLINIGSRSAPARIAHLLLDLCARLLRRGLISGDQEVEIPLTLTHIADALGLTNVYVCQTLKMLRERRLLVFRNGRLRILDPDGLSRVGEAEDLLVA